MWGRRLAGRRLASGADKEKAMPRNGVTPLFRAAQKGHLEVLQHLCKAGAKRDTITRSGTDPQTIATQKGHLKIVQYLQSYPMTQHIKRLGKET